MQTITVLVSAICVVLSSSVTLARSSGSARAPLGSVIDLWVTKTEQIVVPAADALPERSYDFRPTAGEFAHVTNDRGEPHELSAFGKRKTYADRIADTNRVTDGEADSPRR